MHHTATSLRGMVASPHHLASQAGLDIIRQGGTAAEACIATASTLSVVYPHMNSIGGDSFWLVSEPDRRVHAIDACGAAAAKADLALYRGLDSIPTRGPLAANTVAGTISGWQALLDTSGSGLSPQILLNDAITYAESGVPVTIGGSELAFAKSEELRGLPGAYTTIFEPNGAPLQPQEILRQPALGQTLRALARDGFESFYNGKLGSLIAEDLAQLGSPVSSEDLRSHKVSRPQPLSSQLSKATVYNLPPPTQGLASQLILALFDRIAPSNGEGFDHIHRLVEATKQAFLIRDVHIGDPLYMRLNPQELLDNSSALDEMAKRIDLQKAAPWPRISAPGDTVWFGAADSRGQVVSCIQSTYFEFGSGLVLPRTGIIWQNRGSSFLLANDGANALKPGRKPFHTLNPAMAHFPDGRVMAYGTMGGEGQPQTQAAIFSRYAWYDMPLQQTIAAPRWLLGRTWGDTSTSLKLEQNFPDRLSEQLRRAGHDVEIVSSLNSIMGHAGAVVAHSSGILEGAHDPRSDGTAAAF